MSTDLWFCWNSVCDNSDNHISKLHLTKFALNMTLRKQIWSPTQPQIVVSTQASRHTGRTAWIHLTVSRGCSSCRSRTWTYSPFLPLSSPPLPPILSSPPQLSQLSHTLGAVLWPSGNHSAKFLWNERDSVSLNIHIIEIFQRDKESYKAIHIFDSSESVFLLT